VVFVIWTAALFADNLVMLSFTESDVQHALNDFAPACYIVGMKISTTKTAVLHLSRNPDQHSLQMSLVSSQAKEGKTNNWTSEWVKLVGMCRIPDSSGIRFYLVFFVISGIRPNFE